MSSNQTIWQCLGPIAHREKWQPPSLGVGFDHMCWPSGSLQETTHHGQESSCHTTEDTWNGSTQRECWRHQRKAQWCGKTNTSGLMHIQTTKTVEAGTDQQERDQKASVQKQRQQGHSPSQKHTVISLSVFLANQTMRMSPQVPTPFSVCPSLTAGRLEADTWDKCFIPMFWVSHQQTKKHVRIHTRVVIQTTSYSSSRQQSEGRFILVILLLLCKWAKGLLLAWKCIIYEETLWRHHYRNNTVWTFESSLASQSTTIHHGPISRLAATLGENGVVDLVL